MMHHDITANVAPDNPRARNSGFTLLELSIALVIIGILTGVSLYMFVGKVDEAKDVQTRKKLERIEEALLSYRKSQNRLPCPANNSVVESNVNYGMEADNPGFCTGGALAANYSHASGSPSYFRIVEGGVPYKTLELPEDFMYDGWGRRIVYAVDPRMTEIEAFDNYTIYDSCNAITIKDGADGDRTVSASYALISMGANGHGAFQRDGTRFSSASTETDELRNCNCASNGAFDGAYSPVYVQKSLILAGNNSFDDMVVFKERWQLQTTGDSEVNPYTGPEIGFTLSASPYLKFISKNCDVYDAPVDTPVALLLEPTDIDVSRNNNYWALALENSPGLWVLKRDTTTGDLSAHTVNNPPGGPTNTLAIAPNSTMIAIGHGDLSGRFLSFYSISDSSVEKLGFGYPDFQPTHPVTAIAWSPDGAHLAVAYNNTVRIYERSATAMTQGQSIALDDFAVDLEYSPDGDYLAVAHGDNGGAGPSFTILSTDGYTEAYAPTGLGWDSKSVSFSRNTRYLAVTQDMATTQSVHVYRIDQADDSFTEVGNAGLAHDTVNKAKFSPRQHLLFEAGAFNPQGGVIKYIPIEDSLVLQTPGINLGAGATGVAVRHK